MTKEEYIKNLISSSAYNLKSFAKSIDLPYTTLSGMLSRGINGASVQNVAKVCQGLSITVDDLLTIDKKEQTTIPFTISEHEKMVIKKYRELPEMKNAVDALLQID